VTIEDLALDISISAVLLPEIRDAHRYLLDDVYALRVNGSGITLKTGSKKNERDEEQGILYQHCTAIQDMTITAANATATAANPTVKITSKHNGNDDNAPELINTQVTQPRLSIHRDVRDTRYTRE
jgi:hypothetical protein